MPLCPGDRIDVSDATVAHLRLYGEGNERVVRRPSGFVVPGSGTSILSNMLDLFFDQVLPDLQRATANVRMRAGAPEDDPAMAQGRLRFLTPGLQEGAARISLADRAHGMAFQFEGGRAPFDVSVFDPDGALHYRNVGARAHLHDAASVALRQGLWRVRVRDGAGAVIDGAFIATPEPSPSPRGWSANSADPSLRVLWLARCRGREWGLNALQFVVQHRSGRLDSGVMYAMLAQYAGAPAPANCPQ
jgi:hypothetical protein